MAIGRILEVSEDRRTARVLLTGRTDDRIIEEAILSESSEFIRSLPRPGKIVRVVQEGQDWVASGYIREWSVENEEASELDRVTPGDMIIGEGSARIGFYNGGLVVLMANEVTGVMASESNSTINILGHNIYEDNAVHHRSIKTEEGSAVLSEKSYGQVGLIALEKTADLRTGAVSINAEGLTSLDININKALANLSAVSVSIEVSTAGGIVSLKIDQAGQVTLTGPTKIKIEAPLVGINSDCTNPLEGVVTRGCICPYTRLPHAESSMTVYAGRGV